MTNNSIEQAPETGKWRKGPNDGTSEKESGVRWGFTKGESNRKGGQPERAPGPNKYPAVSNLLRRSKRFSRRRA